MAKKTRGPGTALRPTLDTFLEEYLNNGGNGTRAYLASHPTCTSYQAAGVQACRLLRQPKVAEELRKRHRARLAQRQMDGEEAMALIALAARADIAQAYDQVSGCLLPVHEWPDTLRLAVKAVKADGSITLVDPLRARELIATAEGRIKAKIDVNHSFDHAGFLADLTAPSTDTGGKR